MVLINPHAGPVSLSPRPPNWPPHTDSYRAKGRLYSRRKPNRSSKQPAVPSTSPVRPIVHLSLYKSTCYAAKTLIYAHSYHPFEARTGDRARPASRYIRCRRHHVGRRPRTRGPERLRRAPRARTRTAHPHRPRAHRLRQRTVAQSAWSACQFLIAVGPLQVKVKADNHCRKVLIPPPLP